MILGNSIMVLGQVVDDLPSMDTSAMVDTVDRQREDFITASLCIVDPTDWKDDLMGVLGHAFIRIQCPTYDMDLSYSYEGESAENEMWRFTNGNLKMGMLVMPTQEYIEDFRSWNRAVHEYRLNLSPQAKQDLCWLLDQHVMQGKNLPLDLVKRGCSMSLAHIVTQAIGDDKIVYPNPWPEGYDRSSWQIVHDELAPYPWLQLFGPDMMVGNRLDGDCVNEEKMYFPHQLVEVWQQSTLNGQPMITYVDELVEGSNVEISKTWLSPVILAFLILLMTIVGCMYPNCGYWWNVVSLIMATIGGLVLLYITQMTRLPDSDMAWWVVLYNPLGLLIWYGRKYVGKPFAIVLLLWTIGTLMTPSIHIDLFHYVNVATMILMYVIFDREKSLWIKH